MISAALYHTANETLRLRNCHGSVMPMHSTGSYVHVPLHTLYKTGTWKLEHERGALDSANVMWSCEWMVMAEICSAISVLEKFSFQTVYYYTTEEGKFSFQLNTVWHRRGRREAQLFNKYNIAREEANFQPLQYHAREESFRKFSFSLTWTDVPSGIETGTLN